MPKLSGKTALIVGAKSDMGQATARLFAQEGARLALGYGKSKDLVESLATELRGLGYEAMAVGADVSDETEVARMFSEVKQKYGPIDVLINYAGAEIPKDPKTGKPKWGRLPEEITVENFDRALRTDALGSFLCGKHAPPYMNKGGKIIFVSSWPGVHGDVSDIELAAAKASVANLARSYNKIYSFKHGLDIKAVALGSIATKINLSSITPAQKKELEEETELGRMIKPKEVAELMFYIAIGAKELPPHLAEITRDKYALQKTVIPFDGGIKHD